MSDKKVNSKKLIDKSIQFAETEKYLSLNDTKNELTSIEDFIQELSKFINPSLNDDKTDHIFFYRGQANKDWTLTPSIFRDGMEEKEKEITLEIISRQAGKFNEDQTMFDFLIRAQHFGAPTRLLDVTGNPLIALYFACCDLDQINNTGKVFLFRMKREKLKYFNSDRVSLLTNLATLSKSEKNDLRNSNFADNEEGKKQKAEKAKAVEKLENTVKNEKHGFHLEITDEILTSPLLILPKQKNERIIAQQGAFLLHSLNEEDSLNQNIITVKEFTISSAAKGDILRILEILGIHKSSVYPGIQDCAEYLRESFKRLETDAKKGIVTAEYKLGSKLRYGIPPCEKNIEEAIKYFKNAAKKGHAEAQYNLGVMYKKGEGSLSPSNEKAFEWWEKAANQGHAEAQHNLGQMYYSGNSVSRNYQKAREYWEKAAAQGNAKAQSDLGTMYGRGTGVLQDFKRAFEYWEKAANHGLSQAQYNLGVMYNKGDGVLHKSKEKASYWWEKAATQGLAIAQYNLGCMYKNGEGLSQSNELARYWFKKAAEQGDEDAIQNLKKLDAEEAKDRAQASDKEPPKSDKKPNS